MPQWFLWSLLAAVFAAATALLAKVGVAHIDSNLATAIRTTVVVIFAWTIAIAYGSHRAVASIAPRTWLLLSLSGIATGLSWLCYFRALQLGPASRVAPVDKLSVIFVILLAAPLLGESITLPKLLGGGLILAGAIVLAFA
jgi:transporter family protein